LDELIIFYFQIPFTIKMTIIFSDEILTRLSRVRLGIIKTDVLYQIHALELETFIDETLETLSKKYTIDQINRIENIAHARKAYRLIGNDPNRYRPSAESLIRRIVKGQGLYRINNIVDVLNFISLQSGISIGGYDSDKINGKISLGVGHSGEPYAGIGRGILNITSLPALRDNSGAFGTPTSDSERTMITDTTKNVLFVFFDFGYSSQLESYLMECELLLERFCSAKIVSKEILFSDPNHISF
jgi:DNA/RNA-binding domain of Phe-tRNA-synthetase-like protein